MLSFGADATREEQRVDCRRVENILGLFIGFNLYCTKKSSVFES